MNNPLLINLVPLIEGKKEIKIADIGAGKHSRIGQEVEGIQIEVIACDKKAEPLNDVEYQDMEHLTYPDNSFDIVHCANALDHTKDALAAVKEMLRICKQGGWVYIQCWLDQKNTGYKHYWNANEDGILENGISSFNLKDLGFQIQFVKEYEERRYNYIIATFKKS